MLECVYMPRYNIYIRDTDKDLWDSIENKSEFISKALNGTLPKNTKEELKVCPKGHIFKGTKCMQKGCYVV